MLTSSVKLFSFFSVFILMASCHSNEAEPGFNQKPISSIESRNENIIIHFTDHSAQSFSLKELEDLLKKKEISAKTYQEGFQSVKEEKRKIEQLAIANNAQKEKSKTFNINGMNATSVEYKNGKFIFHLANKKLKYFTQDEIDCLLYLSMISEETFLRCMQKQTEEVDSSKNSFGFSFSAREIDCNSCN